MNGIENEGQDFSHIETFQSEDEASRSINQSTNGASTTLHYPIVTQPKTKRKSSVKKPISARSDHRKSPSFSATLRKKTKEFLGLDDDVDGDREFLWTERRIRLANRRYGGVDPELVVKTLPRSQKFEQQLDSPDGTTAPVSYPFNSTYPRYKQSVADYMVDGLSTLGRKLRRDDQLADSKSRSFVPADLNQTGPDGPPDQLQGEQELFFDRSPDAAKVADRRRDRPRAAAVHPAHRNGTDIGLTRIDQSRFPDTVDKREYGIGVVGEAFGRDYRTMVRNRPHVRAQMDEMDDYRPYFTYWVTTVQVVIMVISVILYGFGPVGVELNQSTGQVLSRGLFIEEVDYLEPSNFWLGPRPADLIHLGAKFAPCMRKDDLILAERSLQLEREKKTGCCVRNDHSGCSQSDRIECSTLLSTFNKWSKSNPGPDGRTSGPVCGQDPLYCTAPLSSYTNTWLDDITSWPVCYVSSLPKPTSYWGIIDQKLSPAPSHMTCERIASPCCIGIHGKCEIRTQEFCDFVHGHFHPEATLCSQVSCMQDVCGMLPFVDQHTPDQFYRLLTSLFLHAGLIHLLMSLIIQLYLMRDMEKLCGPVRMSVIYLGSGMAGNLASAIFIPFRAESGPAGAQFGVLASLIVEVLNVWPALKSPGVALGKLVTILVVLILVGLLPWVDNYAHVVGFFTGFLLSYALMPFIAFDRTLQSKTKRAILIVVCLTVSLLIFTTLAVVFYNIPNTECEWCKYLTCIPFTQDFCADQNINFQKDEPIINL